MPTFNTTDPKPGYVYDSSNDTWYPLLGIAPASQVDRWTKTAAGGETSLSGNDDNAVSLSYTAGTEQVYLNGVLLARGSDYTASNGTTITGLTALAASDVAEVVTFNPSNIITTDAVLSTDFDAKGDIIVATADNTVTNLAVGNNGETLVADSSTSTGLRYKEDYAAGKNKIINGDMNIWQRGTTLTFATTGWFNGAADRWMGYSSSNNTATLSQQAFTAGAAPVAGYESQYFLRSASTSTATYLAQRIEDVRTFAGQTVTVSFWAKTNTNQTLSYFNLEQNFGSGGSTTVGNSITPLPALTTSWTRFTATVTLASISGKTIGTSSYLALVLQGDVNKNIDIWGVQVEESSVATAFQTATGTIQGELAACQRYFYQVSGTSNPVFNCSIFTTTGSYGVFPLKQTMRIAPTLTASAASALIVLAVGLEKATTAISISVSNTDQVEFSLTTAAFASNGYGGWVRFNGASQYLQLSAEL